MESLHALAITFLAAALFCLGMYFLFFTGPRK